AAPCRGLRKRPPPAERNCETGEPFHAPSVSRRAAYPAIESRGAGGVAPRPNSTDGPALRLPLNPAASNLRRFRRSSFFPRHSVRADRSTRPLAHRGRDHRRQARPCKLFAVGAHEAPIWMRFPAWGQYRAKKKEIKGWFRASIRCTTSQSETMTAENPPAN